MISEPVILIGQLTGLAFACGINLYATIAVLGLATRLGPLASLPPELATLEQPLVIGSAAALYIVEFVLDKIPYVDSVWDTIHTFIRPGAAALLAVGAAAAYAPEVQVAGGLLAAGVALSAHGSKAGLRLAVHASRWRRLSPAFSLVEDAVAVAIAVTVIRNPAMAAAVAATAVLLTMLVGPVLWRAFLLGIRAMGARLRSLFHPRSWHSTERLPPALRGAAPRPPAGFGPHRVARASVRGLRGIGAYQHGWLVATPEGVYFVYRSFFGPRHRPLPAAHAARLRPGFWADVVDVESSAGNYTVFLFKDGPPAAAAIREILSDNADG
ncbi:MAG TPA: DUF4126 domain-containing protein [Longimicrobiales bacterium]|nr:DUF4126 domain-containing protein [Longimicrobiales bacterium]